MLRYIVITGVLKARTAIHIGSGESNEGFDALLRRNAAGELIIPGTAIAGALRGTLTRLAPRLFEKNGLCKALLDDKMLGKAPKKGCTCAVCKLFGDVDPSDEAVSTEDESRASALLVFNARLKDSPSITPMVRDGVGIDRPTGAAARAGRAKFDLEVLPEGAEFELRMELRFDNPIRQTEGEQLLAAGLAEWQAGRAWLGGNVARGLGGFDLSGVIYATRNLDEDTELMAFLADDEPWLEAKVQEGWLLDSLKGNLKHIQTLPQAQKTAQGLFQYWDRRMTEEDTRVKACQLPIADRWARWDLLLEAQGPLLANDATAAGLSGFDHAPLLSRLHDWTKPVLAGSGVRGVLRSHAERIARTLMTHHIMAEKKDFEAQQSEFWKRCPACDPLARRSTPEPREPVTLECCDSLLRHKVGYDENKEVQPEYLCLACRLFGSTRNGSRLIIEDADYVGKQPPKYKMLDFLAIDRFTGGGAEHFKFDALALWQPTFHLRIFLDNYEDWEMGWLTLVLRDLAEGWLRVGFGAAKGFGQVEVNLQESTLELASLDKPPTEELPQSVYGITSYNLERDAAALAVQQQGWVKDFGEIIKAYRRPTDKLKLPADSFFVEPVYKVYEPQEEG